MKRIAAAYNPIHFVQIALLLFALAVAGNAECQQLTLKPDLRFDNYNTGNNFVSNMIYRVIRSKKGYIWALGNGIYRFDGKQYTHYSKINNFNHGLRDNSISRLAEDEDGKIWFTGTGGICYYDEQHDRFNYLDLDSTHKVTYTMGICRLGHDMWFVSEYGLCKVNARTLKIDTTSLNKHFQCIAICAVGKNTIWLSDRNGLYYVYHVKENKFETKQLDNNLTVWDITTNNDQVWLSTYWGLWMAQNDSDLPQRVKGSEDIHSGAMCFIPNLTGDSIIWVATSHKDIKLFNIRTRKIEFTFEPDDTNPNSILGRYINDIYVDQQSIIWIASEKGLSSLNYRNQNFKTHILPGNIIFRIAQDSSYKNIVWVSGLEHGLTKINWDNKQVLRNYYHFNACEEDPKSGSSIMNMYQVNKDTWLLSSYHVVFTWNSRTGQEKIVSGIPARYFIDYRKDSMFIISSDSIYLCHLPSCKIVPLTAAGRLNDGQYDGNRYLWLPTESGLLRYNVFDKSKKKFRADTSIDHGRANSMFKALIDKKGRVICGTSSGIAIFDTVTQRFTMYESFADIRHPVCYEMRLADSLVFVNSNGGLICLNVNTGQSFILPFRDRNTFSDRPMGIVNDELVIGLKYEYTYFKPGGILKQYEPSPPMIEKIKVNDSVFFAPRLDQPISLKYYQDELTFYFTAFEYTDPEHIQFRYKIEGLDTGWSYASAQRQVDYMRIPPGSYTFIIQAGNAQGTWNQQQTKLGFTISPPYWLTWWFRLLVVFGFVAIVTGIAYGRIRSIKKRELERTQANKEIAEMELKALRSQMNPHFIFNSLNSIQKFIWENKQEDAAEYLTKFSRLIRMILDNSMHKWITLEQEISSLSLYLELEHRRCNNKFDYYINIDPDIDVTNILFPPLILQPFVENAIWHGLLNKENRGALKITIERSGTDMIRCIVEDNGVGRAAAALIKEKRGSRSESHGIKLTHQRLAMITGNGKKGAAEIEDLYDEHGAAGTRVVISIPISAFVKL